MPQVPFSALLQGLDAPWMATLALAIWSAWLGCELLVRLREGLRLEPRQPVAWAAAALVAAALLAPLGAGLSPWRAAALLGLAAPLLGVAALVLVLRLGAPPRRGKPRGAQRLRPLAVALAAGLLWSLAPLLALAWQASALGTDTGLEMGLGSMSPVAGTGLPGLVLLPGLAVSLAFWQLLYLWPAARLRPGRRRAALWRALLCGLAVLGSLAALAGLSWLAARAQSVEPPPLSAPPWNTSLLLALMGGLALLSLRRPLALSLGDGRRVASQDSPQDLQDGLTGLASRLGIERQLLAAVAQCDRQKSRLAVMAFNLDGLGPVNASFGHDGGDELLRQAAQRLRACLGVEDAVGRIGADDFVIIAPTPASRDALAAFAQSALTALARPYTIKGREVSLSCSIGIALYPDHGGQARLLARAGAALAAAKRLGGACYNFFEPGMDSNAREQLDLIKDLRHAIARQELELFYQPKIDAASGQVTAAEALLRWRHPTRGLVPPGVFIPLAERFGLMRELGSWVIDAACLQARRWRDSGLRMRVAINLSAHQMRQADIVEQLEQALARHRVQPSLLTCEITESVAMEDTQATQQTFRALGTLGVHLSIDDFGTGYSSLSYLRRLPASELKIDRAFVTDVHTSPDARAVVDAVVKLAHALGLRVVAEGVENELQHEALLDLGCDELQGYLFARPMSAQAILLWAHDGHAAPGQPRHGQRPAFRPSLFGETQPGGPL